MKRTITALSLALWSTLAFAQAPAPVPALPDAPRLTQYSISASMCNCPVNFALYPDNSSQDVDNWIQVFIGTTAYLSTDPSFGWVLTSPSGSLGAIARPITDAVLNFNAAQTGTVTIVGARRPRRLSQFTEGRGVAARDLNQVVTDIIAENRERWDYDLRGIHGQPGEMLQLLPQATSRAGGLLGFNTSGQPIVVSLGTANVTPVAIASLPTCSASIAGTRAAVNNGIASPTFLQTVSATGAFTQPVFCQFTGSVYQWVYG